MHHLLNRDSYLSALLSVIVTLGFSGQALAQAQTLSTMMFFDGVQPQGGLVSDGAGLYGTTGPGGAAPGGLLYRLALDTSTLIPLPISTIYEYGRLDVWTGAYPGAALMLGGDSNLYGVTSYSSISLTTGSSGTGTLFRVSVSGQDYTKLFEFAPLPSDSSRLLPINTSGAYPYATLIEGVEGGVSYLYGAARSGGANGTGTVFKIRTDGSNFQVLGSFDAIATKAGTDTDGNPITVADRNVHDAYQNRNGVNPNQTLRLGGDGYLYGVTTTGGPYGTGVVFKVSIAGGTIEPIKVFSAIIPGDSTATPPTADTNADGAYPQGGLVLSGGILYGTTSNTYTTTRSNIALSFGDQLGKVFRIGRDGAGFGIVRSFNITDGATPSGDLIITADGKIAGTTQLGGTLPTNVVGTAAGTVYTLSLDGATYNQECVFNAANAALGGGRPQSGVTQVGGNFYGNAAAGLYNFGVIFKCGSPHTGPVLGVQPYVDYNSGGGALPLWMIALLTAVLMMQLLRRQRRI
jgi:uncharacterized repeat protein (TIGR03803 family)